MYDKKLIIPLLLVFAALVTFPVWNIFGKEAAAPQLDLNTPAIQALDQKVCIEDVAYMRTNHMKLLNEWRTKSVREGTNVYVSSSGAEYEMSLENTCFQCHSNKTEFCDKCHTYANVSPDCWQCHVGGE
ncbi:sulfate reduction electron transfer complex DsrMKJOP subunit DsrJ [Candidatus Formimonas warabiya]|uniref:Menaquinol oxidoreductase n=1 Tax=Formimonas warabiya TaxID=1761012 RepID=A0A3G1KXX8_FORW1|nr:sulfate reduction electron transfer complex DsrMKJOP subunit DsrJ [Candidatus Formimonas warabiya]ATW27373.1 menaquinol oxidoreductase [Candidatus Formimonas warabiya]